MKNRYETGSRSQLKKFLKGVVYVVAGAVLIFIGAGIGSSGASANAKTTLNGEVVTVQQLDNQISEEQTKLNELQSKDKVIVDAVNNKTQMAAQIKSDKTQLNSLTAQLNNLDTQISSKQSELDSLTGKIQLAAGAPKILQAGMWIVGKDIPPGRYQATAVDNGSFNFVVTDTSGMPYVNTVLGHYNAGLTVTSYTFTCKAGDQIQTDAPVKLAPVK